MAFITPQQLTTVANSMKTYIDGKDKSNKDELQNAIDAIEVPAGATDAEISAITGLFAAE